MGAHTFIVVARGATMLEAFDVAVKEARRVHGSGGYTGSIAEKHDVVYRGWHVGDEAAARVFAEKELDSHDPRTGEAVWDKWGPAGAVRFGDDGWIFFGWAPS